MIDNYRYDLSNAQLMELYHIVLRLVADGYTWHHRHTQCVLYTALTRYRRGSMVGNVPICTDNYLHEGRFEATVMNSSHSDMPKMSPIVGTGASGKYNKAFGNFQKFMQGLQAEDLIELKRFLLGGSANKQPVSVRTLLKPAKSSVIPDSESLAGTFF